MPRLQVQAMFSPVDPRMRQKGPELWVAQQVVLRHPTHHMNAGRQAGHIQRAANWKVGKVHSPYHSGVYSRQRCRQAEHHIAAGGPESGAKAAEAAREQH